MTDTEKTTARRAFTYRVPQPYSPPPCNGTQKCPLPAAVEVNYTGEGSDPYDYDTVCFGHLAQVLSDRAELGQVVADMTRLVGWKAEYLYVIFDGPPEHVAGRFVDTEGAYHSETYRQPVGLDDRGIQWVGPDEHGYWRLRIPVPSGWLVG